MDDQLSHYRQSIDNIDAALVYMLAERFKVTKAVGELKAREGLPPADPGPEARQNERLRAQARDADLDPDFTEKFLRFIIDEVIRHHQQAKREQGAGPSIIPYSPAGPRNIPTGFSFSPRRRRTA